MIQLQVIGGGKMGEALIGGLIESGWTTADRIRIVEPDTARQAALAEQLPGVEIDHTPLDGVDTLLAVKPDVIPLVCSSLQPGTGRVLSIAAGVRVDTIETLLGGTTPVIRAMPNTPALVGVGAAAIAGGTHATDADLEWAASVLRAVGTVVVVEESDLDAVTGVSGSGPAYVFLLAEALADAARAVGLDDETATQLTQQTILGAATLLADSDDPPSTLRENVTSKGGTTAAGLAVFEDAGFRQLVADVVAAATERSRELGQS